MAGFPAPPAPKGFTANIHPLPRVLASRLWLELITVINPMETAMHPMHHILARSLLSLCATLLVLAPSFVEARGTQAPALDKAQADAVIKGYAAYVHASYEVTLRDARALQSAIKDFVAAPSAKRLAVAKARWTSARVPYGKTEVFRFYEGPIDAPQRGAQPEGPEGRLNAWPMNEAYLDGVKGKPAGGIIHDPKVPITREAMLARNTTEDEAEVTLGWHAIEFMLWGQDMATDGPGARPWTDFAGKSSPAQRRRAYLTLLAEILVDDLQSLVNAWSPAGESYARQFTGLPHATALSHIMSAMATLSGFELASERIAVALDSRS